MVRLRPLWAVGYPPIAIFEADCERQDRITHFAKFPATGVSLRQMVQFGEKPSIGELLDHLL